MSALSRALVAAGIGIAEATPNVAQLVATLYRELAKGTPITSEELERLTVAAEIPAELVKAAAAQWLELDASGNMIGFGGLSLKPTRHTLRLDDRSFYLWCALDGFLVAHVLGRPVSIETRCPMTETAIRVRASPSAVVEVEPASSVMSIIIPESTCACTVANTRQGFCDLVSFYRSADIARDALKGRGTVLSMDEAFALAGELMSPLTSVLALVS